MEKREDVFYLPFRVLASGNRLWYVTEDLVSQFVELTPDFFNNDFFQIPNELYDRNFILEGQHFISPGQRVNIIARPSDHGTSQ
jgi:hypothetical protein